MRYLKNKFPFLIVTFLIVSFSSFSNEGIYQKKYEEAMQSVDSAEYHQANILFLQLTDSDIVLPNNLAFMFGKSLFYTQYYNQSKHLLLRYEKITKKEGLYHTEAIKLLAQLEEIFHQKEVELTKPTNSDSTGAVHSIITSQEQTACKEHEHYICPICNGSKVQIEESSLGKVYSSCEYCDDHGRMNCQDYGKYLNGSLFKKIIK